MDWAADLQAVGMGRFLVRFYSLVEPGSVASKRDEAAFC